MLGVSIAPLIGSRLPLGLGEGRKLLAGVLDDLLGQLAVGGSAEHGADAHGHELADPRPLQALGDLLGKKLGQAAVDSRQRRAGETGQASGRAHARHAIEITHKGIHQSGALRTGQHQKYKGAAALGGLDVIAMQVGRSQDVPRGRLQKDHGFAGDGSCAGYQANTWDGSGSARGRTRAGGDIKEVLVNELL